MQKIESILFDLDETLIVEWTSVLASFTETIHLYNDEIPAEDFIEDVLSP
jgi:hypothetical protein